MKTDSITKLIVIQTEDPNEFQEKFNSAMEEIAMFNDIDYKLFGSDDYRAFITYKETLRTFNSIKDEFHAEGVYYHCRNCPYLEDPHDKRVKHCRCKYSETGSTHKDTEACEMFYRKVMQNSVVPIEDYMR